MCKLGNGRGGTDLNEAWADGVEAHRGTTVAGFPNLFILVGPNTGLGHTPENYELEPVREKVAA